jgi:hypothetical protein
MARLALALDPLFGLGGSGGGGGGPALGQPSELGEELAGGGEGVLGGLGVEVEHLLVLWELGHGVCGRRGRQGQGGLGLGGRQEFREG